jgi:branched-chain amino acid transport system permease protein
VDSDTLGRLRRDLREVVPRLWRMRWAALGAVGLTEARWRGWPVMYRRGTIAGTVGLLALIVLAPLSGFDLAALLSWVVFAALYVPPWERIPLVGRFIPAVGLLAVVVVYPYYNDKLYTIPILGAFPDIHTGVVMLIFVMMAIGLNVVVGYAGLLDLGYVAFYAIGAYTAAWFASVQFAGQNANGSAKRFWHFGSVDVDKTLGGVHITPWLLLLVAGLFTALIGMVIGLPTLRLRGDYLAIVTLGFGEILPQVARNGDNLFGQNLTNGPQGIGPLDPLGFGHTLDRAIGLPANFQTAVNGDDLFFWTAIVLVLIAVFCSIRLRGSRLGRAWVAIREDETAASAMGIPLMRTKTLAYAIGAFFGGVAGAFFALFTSSANPDSFQLNFSVFVLVMVILGGMGNVWGVLFGAAFLAYLDQAGLANTGAWLNEHLGFNIDVPKYEFGIYGVMLLVVMLFRPHGLIPEARRKLEFEHGVHDEPLYDAMIGAGHAAGAE